MLLPLDSLRGCLWENPGHPEPAADGTLLTGKTRGKLTTACWDGSRGIVAIGDRRGSVFCLYLKQNRFSLATEFPAPVTALLILEESLISAHGREILVVDIFTHEKICTLPNTHSREVFCLGFLGQRFFCSVSGDSAIVWDAATAEVKPCAKIFSKNGLFTSASVAADGQVILGSLDGSVAKWNHSKHSYAVIFGASEIGKASAVSSIASWGDKIVCSLAGQLSAVFFSEGAPQPFGLLRPALRVGFGAFPGKFEFAAFLLDDGIVRFVEISGFSEIANFSRDRKAVEDFFICEKFYSIIFLFSDGSFEIADLPDLWHSCRLQRLRRRQLGAPAPPVEVATPRRAPRVALKTKDTERETEMDEKVKIFFSKENSFGPGRAKIWRWALQCPGNVAAFDLLSERGNHPILEEFLARETFIHSIRGEQRLLRLLSALAHWQPIFLDAKDFLPKLVFPFVDFLGDDPLVLFEIVATFLSNFYSRFFDFFPYPPLHVLATAVETLFAADAELADHLATVAGDDKSSGPPGGVGALLWPILKSNFSEILERSDWLLMMDFFIASRGERNIAIAALVALLRVNRAILLREKNIAEVKKLLRTPRGLDFAKFLTEASKVGVIRPLGALLEPQGDKYPEKFVALAPGPVYVAAFSVPEFIDRATVTLVRAKAGIVREKNLQAHQETLAKLRQ